MSEPVSLDRVVGVCRYCRAPVFQRDVDGGRVIMELSTPEGGKVYAHADTSCIPKETDDAA